MKYFKHFTNAHTSEALEELINKLGFEGYGRYWRLLEYLGSLYDGESTYFRIHKRSLRDCLRFRSGLQTDSYLLTIGLQAGYKVELSGNHYEIDAPILAELQSRDYKKARSDRAQTAPKNKIKNKIKIKSKSIKAPAPDAPSLTTSRKSITPDDILEIYQKEFREEKTGFFLGPQSILNFQILSGFPGFQNRDEWQDYFSKVSTSKFLTGKTGKFKASLSWLLDPDNAEKVIQGQYDNASTQKHNDKELWENLESLNLEA